MPSSLQPAASGVRSSGSLKGFTLTLACLASPLAAEITLKHEDETVTVEAHGAPFTVFRSDAAFPYLHPVLGTSNTNLTRHYPMKEDVEGEPTDHPHHRSLWVAHGSVNGVDFWHGKGAIEVTEILSAESGTNEGTLRVSLEWKADDQVLLSELRIYTFSQPDDRTRAIEIECQFKAVAEEVTFEDTKEGTFALRLAPTLQTGGKVARGTMVNSEGDVNDAVWSRKADWAAFHGPDPEGNPAVVLMADHPENPRYPTWWHARGYGLLAANPFGRHDFEKDAPEAAGNLTLRRGETATFRHRVVLHAGDADPQTLSKLGAWPN